MVDVNLGLIDSQRLSRGNLSSEHGEREGEAPVALPMEGATGYPRAGVPLIEFALLDSRLGTIVLVAREKRLIGLDITRENGAVTRKRLRDQYPGATESVKPFGKLQRLLDQFLRGVRVDFDVPFDLGDMGDFSRRVLLEVKAIPCGAVVSYNSIGKSLGYPMAARAVGQAVGRNPIPIVIPCHRVVRSDGRLGGFGMGLSVKEHLLALEGVHLPQ